MIKYSQIIKNNKELLNNIGGNKYKIAILSNIMVHQSREVCEYYLRKEGIKAIVELGEYDNIVQDTTRFQDVSAVIIFWEVYNIIDGLEYKIETLVENEIDNLIDKVKKEIDIVLHNLKNTSLILINKFSSLVFTQHELKTSKIDFVVKELNRYLETKHNITLIDTEKVIAGLSIDKSVDYRYYNSSKTLYSIDFYKHYFEHICPIFLSANGKIKKALIFDCDNTLWKGILGEDGFDKIKVYQKVQYLALSLVKKGVILGLCSKNNSQDVDEVLEKHHDMILRDEHIVIKKVNWENKVINLKAIAKELNIGLDSLVFIDDSNFEVNLIKEELPTVEVFQVPSKEYEYEMMMRKIAIFFHNPKETTEDLKKGKMYKTQVARSQAEKSIGNIEDYLKSLELQITTYIDDLNHVARISQMTQKTNQFNLTTKRYTETDINFFINSSNYTVIAIGISDKFGDNGIVGLAILEHQNDLVSIDTLLMSCRVLGRNIEYKFMDIIIEVLKQKKVTKIEANYIETLKNEQVSDLYDRCGFEIVDKCDELKRYSILVQQYKNKSIDYIGVNNGK